MRRGHPARGRRDEGEEKIVGALRDHGALVEKISSFAVPDLLVGFAGRWTLLEVKDPPGPRGGASRDGQKLSEDQVEFFAKCAALGLPVKVVHNEREAVEAVGATYKREG